MEFRFAYLNEPPFCYRAPDGAVTGCDVELARRVVREIGAASLTFVETEFAHLLPGLRDGRWDMTTGMFVTDERKEAADFSRPIWALPDGLLIRSCDGGAIAGYSSIAQSNGLRLGVVRGQVQHLTAINLGVPRDNIRVFDAYAEAAEAVAACAVDAFASVAMAHRGHIAREGALELAVAEVPASEKTAEPGAFAFARSQAGLRGALDDALDRFLGSADHRALMARFGFTSEDVDRIAI